MKRWRADFIHLHNPSVQRLSSSLSLCVLCLRGVFPPDDEVTVLISRHLFLLSLFFSLKPVIHQIVCRLDSGLSRAAGVLTLRLRITEPSTHHCDHKFVPFNKFILCRGVTWSGFVPRTSSHKWTFSYIYNQNIFVCPFSSSCITNMSFLLLKSCVLLLTQYCTEAFSVRRHCMAQFL